MKMQKTSTSFPSSSGTLRNSNQSSLRFFLNASNKISFDFKGRFIREFNSNLFLLHEKSPTKFATTSWCETQLPYAVYRSAICVYAFVVFVVAIARESDNFHVEDWILSLPAWNFILFLLYSLLLFSFTALQFCDCLCNDDFRWYHKLAWTLQTILFNVSLLCLFGSLIYDTNSDEHTAIFSSDDVNFTYVIAILMIIELLVTNITIRLLHFVYPLVFYLFFIIFHVFRWAAGYTPLYIVVDFGNQLNASLGFMFILLLLFCPVLHVFCYLIDTLRCVLLVSCIKRHRKRFFQVSSAAAGYSSTIKRHNSSHLHRSYNSRHIDATPKTALSSVLPYSLSHEFTIAN